MAKLEVGDVNDPLEREADAVADRLMRMPAPSHDASDGLTPEPDAALDDSLANAELSDAPMAGAFGGAASLPEGPGFVAHRQCASCELEDQEDEVHRSVVDGLVMRKCETCEDEAEIRRACGSCDAKEDASIRRSPAEGSRRLGGLWGRAPTLRFRDGGPVVDNFLRRSDAPTPGSAFAYDRHRAFVEASACDDRPRYAAREWLLDRRYETSTDESEIRRACAGCDLEGDDEIHREAAAGWRGGPTSGEFATQLRSRVRSGGRPLPDSARNFLEPRLGVGLGHLRMHDDVAADSLAKQINARAFTIGTNIFFASGESGSTTRTGMRLLAHEVAHTLQTGRSATQPMISRAVGEEVNVIELGDEVISLMTEVETFVRDSLIPEIRTLAPDIMGPLDWRLGRLRKAKKALLGEDVPTPLVIARGIQETLYVLARATATMKEAFERESNEELRDALANVFDDDAQALTRLARRLKKTTIKAEKEAQIRGVIDMSNEVLEISQTSDVALAGALNILADAPRIGTSESLSERADKARQTIETELRDRALASTKIVEETASQQAATIYETSHDDMNEVARRLSNRFEQGKESDYEVVVRGLERVWDSASKRAELARTIIAYLSDQRATLEAAAQSKAGRRLLMSLRSAISGDTGIGLRHALQTSRYNETLIDLIDDLLENEQSQAKIASQVEGGSAIELELEVGAKAAPFDPQQMGGGRINLVASRDAAHHLGAPDLVGGIALDPESIVAVYDKTTGTTSLYYAYQLSQVAAAEVEKGQLWNASSAAVAEELLAFVTEQFTGLESVLFELMDSAVSYVSEENKPAARKIVAGAKPVISFLIGALEGIAGLVIGLEEMLVAMVEGLIGVARIVVKILVAALKDVFLGTHELHTMAEGLASFFSNLVPLVAQSIDEWITEFKLSEHKAAMIGRLAPKILGGIIGAGAVGTKAARLLANAIEQAASSNAGRSLALAAKVATKGVGNAVDRPLVPGGGARDEIVALADVEPGRSSSRSRGPTVQQRPHPHVPEPRVERGGTGAAPKSDKSRLDVGHNLIGMVAAVYGGKWLLDHGTDGDAPRGTADGSVDGTATNTGSSGSHSSGDDLADSGSRSLVDEADAGAPQADVTSAQAGIHPRAVVQTRPVEGSGRELAFDSLSVSARDIVMCLHKSQSMSVTSVSPADLAQASAFLGRELGVLQSNQTGRLRLVLGTETGVLRTQLRPGEFVLVHTHPVYISRDHHFLTDLANPYVFQEMVVDWGGFKTHLRAGAILNPRHPTRVNERQPFVGRIPFVDSDGNIVGYSSFTEAGIPAKPR